MVGKMAGATQYITQSVTNATDLCASSLSPICRPGLSIIPGSVIRFAYALASIIWWRLSAVEQRSLPLERSSNGVGVGVGAGVTKIETAPTPNGETTVEHRDREPSAPEYGIC